MRNLDFDDDLIDGMADEAPDVLLIVWGDEE